MPVAVELHFETRFIPTPGVRPSTEICLGFLSFGAVASLTVSQQPLTSIHVSCVPRCQFHQLYANYCLGAIDA